MRTVRLTIVSLAVVGLAFSIYQLGVEPIEETPTSVVLPEVHRRTIERDHDEGPGVLIDGDVPVRLNEPAGVTILDERTLRKKLHMKFDNPRQLDDSGKLFHISNPIITYYLKRGQQAVIRADQATLNSREKGRIDPQRGTFKGNVRIDLDRSTESWRESHPQLADRPTPQDLLVRLWMEELEFDLDLERLDVPGAVRVEAREMRLQGVGLHARWRESLGRVENVRLDRGVELVFKGALGLEGGLTDWKEQTAPPVIQDAGPQQETEVPVTPVQRDQPSSQLVELDGEMVLVIDLPQAEPPPLPRVLTYQVDFDSDVQAQERGGSGGRLTADHLSVLLDVPANLSDSARGRQEDSKQPNSADAASQPAGSEEGSGATIAVVWQGPLEITATGEAETADTVLRRQITAEGSPVVIENADGRASCARFTRHLESDFVQFLGRASIPVDIAGGRNTSFGARDVVTLDVAQRRAHLEGDVRVVLDGSVLRGQVVDAYFREPVKGSGRNSLRDLLDVLHCSEDVSLERPGEQIHCRDLTVNLSPDENGVNIPRSARALHDVGITQGARTLSASQSMDVTFGSLAVDGEGRVVDETPPVRSLDARGQVRILDPPRNWDIAGEQLNCEFDDAQVMTTAYIEGPQGAPARVQMGAYYVEGATVHFDEARAWAHVPGPGVARFVVTEDLDGRRSAEPVPVEVRFGREMKLLGDQNLLVFSGPVQAQSRHNTLTCSEMLRVSLADVSPEPEQAGAPQDPWGMWFLRPVQADVAQMNRKLGLGPREHSSTRGRINKRATYILAEGEAVLRSRSEDAQGHLRSLVVLEGPRIGFDLDKRVLLSEGAGHLDIHDYPAADTVLAAQQQPPRGRLFSDLQAEGPSQTRIRWDSYMRYHFAQRVAEFQGKDQPVRLYHLSGAHIRTSERLEQETGITSQELDRLRTGGKGRNARLTCERLLVQFGEPGGGGRGAGEMSVGELSQFQATGDVLLNDLELYLTGDRLDFVAATQLISVYGFSNREAYISTADPQSGEVYEVSCPELHIELETSHVDAPGCQIRASRRVP